MLKFTKSLILLLSIITTSTSIIQTIKIGAIFHENDNDLEQAFDQALNDLNNDQNTFFNLKPIKKINVPLESFVTENAVCELLNEGVVAVIGPQHPLGRDVVSSTAERFNVPHLEYSYRYKIKTIIIKTKYGRKTGIMNINDNGERNFKLKVIVNQAGQSINVGEWNKNSGLKFSNNGEREFNDSFNEIIKNKVFKVTTLVTPPYVTLIEDKVKGRFINGNWYEGYCIDLIGKIEVIENIKFEFEIVPDGKHGFYNPKTKQWTGLIKRLLKFKADFAIGDLSITSERQSAIDFTPQFMNLGISKPYRRSDYVKPDLLSFISPSSPIVWLYLVTTYLLVSLMMHLQSKIISDEWINPRPRNREPNELDNNFTLMMNSMWFTLRSLMQQGSDILPRTLSLRVTAGIWWFFVLIMVSSYTANLAAFLIVDKMDSTINDIEDLVEQTQVTSGTRRTPVTYDALKDASTFSFFKNSNDSLYKRMFDVMNDAKPSVFTKSNDEGVDRVIEGKRQYAYLMESTTIDYQIERNCELIKIDGLLDSKGYGIAMPRNTPYRTFISTAILKLKKGELNELKQKWWNDKGDGICDDNIRKMMMMMILMNLIFIILVGFLLY